MSQHTPGPWINCQAVGQRLSSRRIISDSNKISTVVADVPDYGETSASERHANARLIAAAPDDKPDHSLEQSIHAILAAQLHYPRCWDTAAYPTLYSAIDEVLSSFQCTNEDTHPVAALEQVSRDCQWQASLDDKRDAERYRFMQGNESIKFWDGLGALHPSEWDEFIDAAMKGKP